MPESMFGHPSQHLLPFQLSANAAGSAASAGLQTTPVHPSPPRFEDFRFNSIGRQPGLLSRMSLPNSQNDDYHSPSRTSVLPSAISRNDIRPQPKTSSRPTLIQQLTGGDHDATNGLLISRIQTNASTSDNSGNVTLATIAKLPPPRPGVKRAHHIAEENNGADSLIPPIEFLPPARQSVGPSPPPGFGWQVPGSVKVLKPISSTLSRKMIATTTGTSAPLYPTSPVSPQVSTSGSANVTAVATANDSVPGVDTTASPLPMSHPTIHSSTSMSRGISLPQSTAKPSSSFAAAEVVMRDLTQPFSSAMPTLDSLASHQARLQAISNNLANLASPLPLPSLSPSPGPSAMQIRNTLGSQGPSRRQQEPGSMALHHPYQAKSQSPSGMNGDINDVQMDTNSNDNASALTTSSSALTRELQTQTGSILEAVRNINSALSTAHRAQIEAENALEDRRATFERQKQTEEVALQAQFRQLHEMQEELSVREASLVALEQENRVKEEAGKAMRAKLQAQEEKRVHDDKSRQEAQEQIARALEGPTVLRALRAGGQFTEAAVSDDLPTEPQQGMNEEEEKVIKQRNNLMGSIECIRRMYDQEMQVLEESTRTLRKLQEERKKKDADAVRRHGIAEEGLLAEAASGCQAADEPTRRQCEAEEERRMAEIANRGRQMQESHSAARQPQLLAKQHTRAEAQAHGLQQKEAFRQEEFEKKRARVMSLKQQANAENAARIRAAREGNSISPTEVNNAMEVDDVATTTAASYLQSNVPLMDTQMDTEVPQQAASSLKSKKAVHVSDGVTLSVSHYKASGKPLPSKLSVKRPPSSSSSSVQENTKTANSFGKVPSFVSASTEAGRQVQTDTPLFPILLASELNSAGLANANAHLSPTPSPGQKHPFTPNPKSQTLLDVDNGGALNIGPCTVVSPAQRNVNLRHLKISRSRIEENGSGDRSVRRSGVKSEDSIYLPLKKEEHDDRPLPREPEWMSSSQHDNAANQTEMNNVPISHPSRLAVLPPPRPRVFIKPTSKLISSHPSPATEGHEPPFTGGEADTTSDEQPQAQQAPTSLPRASPSAWVMDAAAEHQEWAPVLTPPPPPETANSLLLGLSELGSHSTELRGAMGEGSTANRYDNHEAQGQMSGLNQTKSASPEPSSVTLSLNTEGEDHPRNKRRLSDENRKKYKRNNVRRQPPVRTGHYSPVPPRSRVPSPSQSYLYRPPGDFWRPESTLDVPRVEPLRALSPTVGRKRPSDFHDNEHNHRSRRPRGDVRTPHDHDWDQETWNARDKERRPHDPDSGERRNSFRAPPSPDRSRPYPSDTQRVISDRPLTSPPSGPLTVPTTRWEQLYRRSENEENRYQQYQLSAGSRGPTGDQYRPKPTSANE
ncbi:hypothetical protein BS17DRAFT_451940 [Gyrodon lividus]|nr:hypothetical protein BS17DRAFT_451940 [Gyrodon lividus]